MKIKKLILILNLCFVSQVFCADFNEEKETYWFCCKRKSRKELIKEFSKVCLSKEIFIDSSMATLESIKKAYPQINESNLSSIVDKIIPEIFNEKNINELAVLATGPFSNKEIQEIISFYRKPLGMKLTEHGKLMAQTMCIFIFPKIKEALAKLQ